MQNVKDEQIEKLLEDIASIKFVIKQNKSIVRQLFLPSPFRRFLLMFGLIIILYSDTDWAGCFIWMRTCTFCRYIAYGGLI